MSYANSKPTNYATTAPDKNTDTYVRYLLWCPDAGWYVGQSKFEADSSRAKNYKSIVVLFVMLRLYLQGFNTKVITIHPSDEAY